ncbi:MAG: ABC transporter ATP-binding protein [Moraxellaceae bacterium]|nr:ABC transporter ATP-binding protein [Moraxellaceae bacterium]
MTPILAVEHLRKQFGELVAVDDVSFAVRPGICFGLLGPNGAGKTTTIEMIEGITAPGSGRILFKGAPVDAHFRERCGIQFQQTALPDFLTTREALALFARFYRRTLPLAELVQACALESYLDQYASKLSGGQRQRLLLAIALINDPDIIFLDEPTTGLDPQARRNFWTLIEQIKARGKTIILTTHYMDEAELLCDELAIMDRGRIIADGTPQALLRTHFDAMRVRLDRHAFTLTQAQWHEPMELREDAVEILSRDVASTLSALIARGVPLASLEVRPPTLEDLFIKLTGHALRN